MDKSSDSKAKTVKKSTIHYIDESDLPIFCPPKEDQLWNQHPKVYLPISPGEIVCCPYCGNKFSLSQ